MIVCLLACLFVSVCLCSVCRCLCLYPDRPVMFFVQCCSINPIAVFRRELRGRGCLSVCLLACLLVCVSLPSCPVLFWSVSVGLCVCVGFCPGA